MMFDFIRGCKFTRKCKEAIRCILIRVPMIQKRKHAMLRIQLKVIAGLIEKGQDINAFNRMKNVCIDLNNSACCDHIKKYCKHIEKQLPMLQERRECPQDAVEAVATLIYAAARFSDLPELRDLRRLFTDRYGDKTEQFVNAEFMGKQKKSFSTYEKLYLMQKIAEEYFLSWDYNALEQKLSSPASAMDQSNEARNSSNITKGEDADEQIEEIPGRDKFEATEHAEEEQQRRNAYDRCVNHSIARPLHSIPPPYHVKPKVK